MMDYFIVVIGGAQARFFTLVPVDFPELESGPRLVERGQLSNPLKELPGRELYTDAKTGRGRAPGGGPSHGYDDHRSQHEDESDRRFGRSVLDEAKHLAKAHETRYLIIVAPSRVLGLLRHDLDIISKQGQELRQIAKDMTKFSPRQIHDFLAKEDLVPPCKRPGT